MGKKKKEAGGKPSDVNGGQTSSLKGYDEDTLVFISMAQELKEEGNRLFQKRDYEGALLKYEKGLRLLPGNHIEVSQLRTNMAACHMQLGLSEYPNAINECNLALEVTPKYTKALLKRARCYEGLNRLDLALRDVSNVINLEPNNLTALEFGERVREAIEKRGLVVNSSVIELPLDYVPPNPPSLKEKTKKKKNKKVEDKTEEPNVENNTEEPKVENKTEKPKVENNTEEPKVENKTEKSKVGNKTKEKKAEKKVKKKKGEDRTEEKKAEDKAVVEEKISVTKTVKLVFGEDIRWAQLPLNCSLVQLREVIHNKFPTLGSVLVKFKDQEGDLVTITSTEELRFAEASPESHGNAVRLYIVEVDPKQDPLLETLQNGKQESVFGNGSTCIDDWIIDFARLFKNYIGLDCDAYLNLHELGMKFYSDAMEEVTTSEEAQLLFDGAAGKFQEMAALAFFNWGNVHMSRARKTLYFTENTSQESILTQIKTTYDWAVKEYSEAGIKYSEAIKIKPDFCEGFLALGQQQFELAKLSWYHAIGIESDSDALPSKEVLKLYNSAEDNMEKGMQMWEESEEQRVTELSKPNKAKLFTDMSSDEAAEQAANMRSQINLLWGTMLYERSIVEFKLGLPVWQECLEVAIEKFELAGASPIDTAVMIKNHCSNSNAVQGLSFKIDEIVQAWNEMYEARRWSSGVPSFRLEPLLRRRVSKLVYALDNA